MLWSIKVITFILKHCNFTQYSKTMSKTTRNKELTMIFPCQLYRYMLTIGRRTLADINSHIQHCTLYATYQLTLAVRHSLKMQPPHHSIRGHTFIILYKLNRTYLFIKLPLRKRFEEIPPVILKKTRFNNHHPFNICLNNFHTIIYSYTYPRSSSHRHHW